MPTTLGPFGYVVDRTVVGKVSLADTITSVWNGSAFVAFDPTSPVVDATGDTAMPETTPGTYGPTDLPAGLTDGTYWASYWDLIDGEYWYRYGETVTVGSPLPATSSSVQYTDAARVTRRVSTLGVELRTDAAPGDGMAEAMEEAAADVEFYCGARYLPVSLAGDRWVQKIATDLAVYYLCMIRLGPPPKAVVKMYDKAVEKLEHVKAGVWTIPGLPQGRSSAPSVTNFSVSPNLQPGVRVDRPRSTGKADGYRRPIDYPGEYLGPR